MWECSIRKDAALRAFVDNFEEVKPATMREAYRGGGTFLNKLEELQERPFGLTFSFSSPGLTAVYGVNVDVEEIRRRMKRQFPQATQEQLNTTYVIQIDVRSLYPSTLLEEEVGLRWRNGPLRLPCGPSRQLLPPHVDVPCGPACWGPRWETLSEDQRQRIPCYKHLPLEMWRTTPGYARVKVLPPRDLLFPRLVLTTTNAKSE